VPRASYRQQHTPAAGHGHATPPPPPHTTAFARWFAERPQLPYVLPFFAFVLLAFPATFGPAWKDLWHAWHPFIYAAKTLAAGALLWYFWGTRAYAPVRWSRLAFAALLGLLGTALWIFCYDATLATPWWRPITDVYNPDLELHSPAARWAYLCIRVAGPVLVVPLMEELFFRDFLMRALIRGPRFEDVPIGAYTPLSLFGTALLFGLNHGSMWPSGVLYGLLMGVLLVRTKSLGACIVAHAVTNWTLYLFVIYTGRWEFM
jgi:CAAX prenyl protease-like protein